MSTSTTRNLRRGEVYYIHSFPTCGSEQRSGRPAVIVSNNECNAHSEVVEVCYLTLKEKSKLPTHVFIDIGPCINSTVLCEQITSVSIDRIGDYMCFLPDYLLDSIDNALVESLALRPVIKLDPKDASGYQRTPDSVMAELESVKHENVALKHELDTCHKILDDYNIIKSKAEMYERMYNDLLDRLVNRGAK